MQPRSHEASWLEWLTLAHLAIFFVGTTWAFGGNADFVRPYLIGWGTVGAAITLGALLQPSEAGFRGRQLRRLIPFLAFNAFTLVACLTPGFRPIRDGLETMYLPRFVPAWRPSSAIPGLARDALALYDGLYLSAFNLFMLVRRRRSLRALLLLMMGNGLALAVFGTIQKLAQSKGLYFGAVHSPQEYFFSSFVYNNHWGAFVILLTAMSLGLVLHYTDHAQGRDFFHSPAFGGTVAIFTLAITVPLSGARICSTLTFLLLAFEFLRWARSAAAERRQRRRSAAPVLAAAIALGAFGLGTVWWIGRATIEQRIEKTRLQVSQMRAQGGLGSRALLYRNTWRMARARILFGWGMASYPHAFMLYNTEEPNSVDHLPKFYHDAHSDWLQALAEHGLAGTALLVWTVLGPLAAADDRAWNNRLSRRMLLGCAIVVLYAIIEFPFGNVAVTLTWLILFFGALRYGVLSGDAAKVIR